MWYTVYVSMVNRLAGVIIKHLGSEVDLDKDKSLQDCQSTLKEGGEREGRRGRERVRGIEGERWG